MLAVIYPVYPARECSAILTGTAGAHHNHARETMSLEGQVAVITGGAGGIGWASALEWMAKGGKVVIADLASQEATFAKKAAGHEASAAFVTVDTRVVEDLERCAEVAAGLGTLTCWFNNAGFAYPGDDIDFIKGNGLSPELRNMLEVNTLAHINGSGVAMRPGRQPTRGLRPHVQEVGTAGQVPPQRRERRAVLVLGAEPGARARGPRCTAPLSPRVRSHCRFMNRAAEYVSESGILVQPY